MREQDVIIRWARRVSQKKIRRLYEMDASGIVDEDLIDDVGIALYSRCETIMRATEWRCPECGCSLQDPGPTDDRSRPLSCPDCSWQATWRQYHRSFKGKRINGGAAYPNFLAFLREYPTSRTPQQKMLCTDRLVHAVHMFVKGQYGAPAAQNVIGGTRAEVRELLDTLAYTDDIRRRRPGIRDTYQEMVRESEKQQGR